MVTIYFRPVETRELLQDFMNEGKSYVGVEQLIRDDIHLLLLCAKSSEVNLVSANIIIHITFVLFTSANVLQGVPYKAYID